MKVLKDSCSFSKGENFTLKWRQWRCLHRFFFVRNPALLSPTMAFLWNSGFKKGAFHGQEGQCKTRIEEESCWEALMGKQRNKMHDFPSISKTHQKKYEKTFRPKDSQQHLLETYWQCLSTFTNPPNNCCLEVGSWNTTSNQIPYRRSLSYPNCGSAMRKNRSTCDQRYRQLA